MQAGQLGHKMNDSDIHDQLVCNAPLRHGSVLVMTQAWRGQL